MWDLIVSVPDHCLSFYFENTGAIYRKYMQIETVRNSCRNKQVLSPSVRRSVNKVPRDKLLGE